MRGRCVRRWHWTREITLTEVPVIYIFRLLTIAWDATRPLKLEKKNVRRQIRNVRKLWECQLIFGTALDERTNAPLYDDRRKSLYKYKFISSFLYRMRIVTNSKYDFHLIWWWAKGHVHVEQSLTNKLLRKEIGMNIPKDKRSSLPDDQLQLICISPVRDSVHVDCNRHINTLQACGGYKPTRVRD